MAKGQSEVYSDNAFSNEQGLKLLLVDEDAKDLDYYSAVLRRLGYEVRSVGSYAEAAASLDRERFDLVIVDQGSSDFEGRAVLTRAVEIDRHVPVLVLTRTVDVGCCIDALDAGAYEYVQKPLTTAELRELVSDYLKPSTEGFSAGQQHALHQNFAREESRQAARESWREAS
jgi:two-component system, NtrC family, response regulator PilR